MKKLYKFHWQGGRMGDIEGVFVSTDEIIKKSLGLTVYFGEILGKHSEIYGDFEETDLTVLSVNQDFIEKFEKIIGSSGYNPLKYIKNND
jgi:hypothetical protein